MKFKIDDEEKVIKGIKYIIQKIESLTQKIESMTQRIEIQTKKRELQMNQLQTERMNQLMPPSPPQFIQQIEKRDVHVPMGKPSDRNYVSDDELRPLPRYYR